MTEQTTAKQSKDVVISKFEIIPFITNITNKTYPIQDIITDIYYYEGILEPSIRMSVIYVDSGKSFKFRNNQNTQTLFDGLPLQGTERVEIKMEDGNNIKLEIEQFISQIAPLGQEANKSVVTLDLISKEGIVNSKTKVKTRYDGKISDHVKKILKDAELLGTEKALDIEETENSYIFIGNQKRPFYSILWLAKKSIGGKDNMKGYSAGFLFFETSKGFIFKSIDSLFSQKPVKKFIYNMTPDGSGKNISEGYNAKILKLEVGDAGGDIESKLQIGTYSTRLITFDPFNCYYNVSVIKSEDTESKLNLVGKNLPKVNPIFIRDEGQKQEYSRTQYMLIDRGTFASVSASVSESTKKNFDPQNILSQSAMRYNQLFNYNVFITIVADFSLHAGDMISIDIPEISNSDTPGLNKQLGGNYLIASLCHYRNKLQGAYTKLTLSRDSYGKSTKEETIGNN
jgi:hypothetical protein